MKINEVMKETGLTKKAIYYYENEGLIKPQKDPDNNYRHYTEEEIRKLIVINILRRLDIPIKAIGDIVNNSVSIKDVLKEQLVLTNQKINQLYQNKIIMNDLILKDIDEGDFTFKTLKKINRELEELSQSSGHVGKELERIFPGTLGKILGIFYSHFLDVPLDTDEKISAWNDLVRKLDEMKEIDFPDEIQRVVEDLYGEVSEEQLAHWERISRRVVDESLVGYYANPENQKKIEGYYKLQSFIINNLDMFLEIDKYIAYLQKK